HERRKRIQAEEKRKDSDQDETDGHRVADAGREQEVAMDDVGVIDDRGVDEEHHHREDAAEHEGAVAAPAAAHVAERELEQRHRVALPATSSAARLPPPIRLSASRICW